MAQAMKLSVLIGGDASGLKAGAAEAEQALNKIGKAANDAGRSIQATIDAELGLSKVSLGDRGADIQNYGAQLDALRARYNPLFSVITRYKTEVQGIRQAHALGAISTTEMTAAISRERQATLASIDAIKGRSAAIRAMPTPANTNARNFETGYVAAQGQDILVSAFGGMSPLQIALQQGTQLSAIVGQMERPVAGLVSGFAALASPISLATIGVVGLSAAAIQYFTTAEDGTEKVNALLEKQNEVIRTAAQLWGDAVPAFKSYVDQLDRASKLKAGQDAVDVLAGQELDGLAEKLLGINDKFAAAGRSLRQIQVDPAFIRDFAKDFSDLRKKLDDGTASIYDINKAQSILAVAVRDYGTKEVRAFDEAFKNITASITKSIAAAMQARQEFIKAVAGGTSVQDIIDNNTVRDFGRVTPAFVFTPREAPVPTPRPSDLDTDPNEEANKKLEEDRKKAADALAQQKKQYDDFIAAQNTSIAKAELELSLQQASTAERARALALFEAEQKIQDLKLDSASKEAQLIREKAAAQADLNAQIAGQRAVQQSNDDIARLRLEISLVGASAETRARAIAAYETEKQIRDQGINSLSAEANALRANAQARADLQLQLERQQAAYQSLQQAEGSAIDSLVTGTGTLKDRLKGALDSMLQWLEQMAIANPLKNALTGTNLPTLGDLFSGKTASPTATTSTAAMTVNAGTVMINGAPLGTPSSPLGGLLGANNNQPAAANQNVAPTLYSPGLVNVPPASATTTTAPTTNIEAFIRATAPKYGVDPNTAVAVARSEGGLTSWNMQSQYVKNGVQEPSYGPYQLYMNGGLGNRFQTETGLDPRLAANGPAATEWSLKYASQNGWSSWYGARNTGISDWQGINRGAQPLNTADNGISRLNQTATAASTQIDKMGTGAIDASKALTDGNNSLVGSITKASQTAAQPAAPATPGANPLTGSGSAAAPTGNIFSSITSTIGGLFKGITGMFSNLFSSLFSGIGSIFGGLFANGGAFSSGNVIPFAAGGVVTKPTLFPMAGGRTGVMGEAGPEAIMPLHRGPGGKLGVAMSMPGGGRQGNEMRVNLTSHNTLVIQGTGDAELHQQWKEGTEKMLSDRDRQWRNNFTAMVKDAQQNPNVRKYG